jgi:ferric-dicitrate binding protein FerR (iron transport regulator)
MIDWRRQDSRRGLERRHGAMAQSARRRAVALSLIIALLKMFSAQASQAAAPERVKLYGEIIAAGAFKVDGLAAFSGQTFCSGNSIETAHSSTAIVNLGKLGRLELLPDTGVRLSFDETSLTGWLDDGSVRLSIPAGIRLTMTTKDGAVAANDGQPAVFSISIKRGETILTTHSGSVTLRAGGETRQVAAGQSANADYSGLNVSASQPKSVASQNSSGGQLAALLLLIGGVIATAAIVFTGNHENRDRLMEDFGGPVVIPSGP